MRASGRDSTQPTSSWVAHGQPPRYLRASTTNRSNRLLPQPAVINERRDEEPFYASAPRVLSSRIGIWNRFEEATAAATGDEEDAGQRFGRVQHSSSAVDSSLLEPGISPLTARGQIPRSDRLNIRRRRPPPANCKLRYWYEYFLFPPGRPLRACSRSPHTEPPSVYPRRFRNHRAVTLALCSVANKSTAPRFHCVHEKVTQERQDSS